MSCQSEYHRLAPNCLANDSARSDCARLTATNSDRAKSRSAGATRFWAISPHPIRPHLTFLIYRTPFTKTPASLSKSRATPPALRALHSPTADALDRRIDRPYPSSLSSLTLHTPCAVPELRKVV